jgi:phosphohistidine phosphatase
MKNMKKLLFVRHGIAEEQAFEITDFERSLTPKGKTISKKIARKLLGKESTLGVIITSAAFRALETAYIFAGEFGIKPESVIVNSSLYNKMNARYLTELLSLTDSNIETVTLFGHNPAFTEIADILCKQGCDFIPKSGVVCISFNVKNWSEIQQHNGRLEYFLKPE